MSAARTAACAAALIAAVGCLPGAAIKLPLDCTPVDLGDGWPLSTPEAQGLDPARVEALCTALFAEDAYPNVLTLQVIQDGALIADAAFRDPQDRSRVHHMQSISKSITSLVTGIAIDQGLIPAASARVDRWLGDAFPRDEPAKRAMTVEHLLTMTGGIDVSNTEFAIEVLMNGRADSVAWLLSRPLYAEPGARMYYRDADPHILAAVLAEATGEPFDRYARRVLFEPLGITSAHIEAAPDGSFIAAAGVWMRPRDLARIGLLALDQGRWGDSQVVSATWMETSTQHHAQPLDEGYERFGYGYYWWLLPQLGAFTAVGHGGQYVTIFPEQRLVVVLTATPYASSDIAVSLPQWHALMAALVGR